MIPYIILPSILQTLVIQIVYLSPRCLNKRSCFVFTGHLSHYKGGGYIAALGKTLTSANETLQSVSSSSWIDEGSAAVVLEFIIYTANLNLATSVQVVFEFPSSGGILKSTSLHTMRLYRSTHGFHIFVLVFELIYIIWTIYFIIHEIRTLKVLKLKYFSHASCVLDLCGCVLSVVIICLYIAQVVLVKDVTRSHKSGLTIYRSFRTVTLLDCAINYTLSFIVVIGMLKFLHLLRFNPLIYKFMCMLRYGFSKLVAIGTVILVLIGSFGHMMHLAAGRQVQIFSTFRLSVINLFVNMLGSMYTQQFQRVHDVVIGPFVMILFNLLVAIFLVNMLIVVLMEALDHVNRFHQPLEEAEMLWLLVDKFVQWLGIGRSDKCTAVKQVLPNGSIRQPEKVPPTIGRGKNAVVTGR